MLAARRNEAQGLNLRKRPGIGLQPLPEARQPGTGPRILREFSHAGGRPTWGVQGNARSECLSR